MARPEAKDMTMPKENREVKGVVFDGGETGSKDNALKMASRIHATQ